MYKRIEGQSAGGAKKNSGVSDRAANVCNNSRTLFVVFPTLEEFLPEREVLSTIVIPELQAFCCERDFDLECSTFFATNFDYGQLSFLLSSIEQGTANVLVFIGDKYGDTILPLEIRPEEYNAIQSAALEISSDVKLLEQCYAIDKTKSVHEYRLQENPWGQETVDKLRTLLQQGAKRAKDDGNIHQIDEERQQQFHQSFIETVVNAMLKTPGNHLFLLRSLDYTAKDAHDRWADPPGPKTESMKTIKNKIALRASEANRLPYFCKNDQKDPNKWFQGKDSDDYKHSVAMDLSERLKTLLNVPAPSSSSYSVSPMEVALREHVTHDRYAFNVKPQTWVTREVVDKQIAGILQQGMTKSAFVQFYGPSGAGKTAVICRLYDLLQQQPCFVIARFGLLTDDSVFVNELLRNVLLKACDAARISSTAMLNSFHLTEILADFKLLTERQDRPLFLLIDDVHLLKFGKTLCSIEKPLRKLFPKLSFVFTSALPQQVLTCFAPPELVELPHFSRDQAIEILKTSANGEQKLTSEQFAQIRQKVKKTTGTVIMAKIQYEEFVQGYGEPSEDFESRLARIEGRVGVEPVRIVCQLLCSLPYGLTVLELIDGYRLSKRNSGMEFDPNDVLSPTPLLVLRHLGHMLVSVCTDKREVWMFRHGIVAQVVRQRYLPAIGDVKLANEIMAELLTYVPSLEAEAVAPNLTFPQPILRENGSVNLRRIRYHWYYLLHAGKLDHLKDLTLCSFDYLEACFRGCGIAHLLSIFEECSQQILDHDILVLFEQVLLPAIPTLIRDKEQLVCELLNRLRFTSGKNSERLNTVIEQSMTFADTYSRAPLLLPLTCWISPPKMKQVVSFAVPQWKSTKTVVQPTHNHQHLLITGNELNPGHIYMYHIASSLLVKTFTGHSDRVSSICASHDGQFFASTSYDGSIRLWSFQATKGECMKTIQACKAKIMCSLLSNDDKLIITGSTDSTARVINVDSGVVQRAFRDHTGPVIDLQLSSDNTLLVTGSGDFVVMVWDIQAGEVIIKMGGLMAPVTCLAITSNDAFLTVACEDETVRVFSMVSSQELHVLSGHDARVNALAASADDCQLFAATRGKILCYDIHNSNLLETLDCGSNLPVTSLKITDDNSFVLAACGDRIHMWNMNSIERSAPHNAKSKLSCVKLAPDERSAACGTIDGIVAFWDLDLCSCLWSTTPQKCGAVTALDFSCDSNYVLSGSEHGNISIWESTNGGMLRSFTIHDYEVRSICCFVDGTRVLSCDESGVIHVWNFYFPEDPNAVEVLATVSNIKGPLYLGLSDSVLIGYNAKNRKEMNIWSLTDNKFSVKTKVHHNEEINCYYANKVGTVLVTGSMDNSLKIWQVDTGFLIQVLVGHDDVVLCCCVSEDGKIVVSGGQDRHIYIWDVQTGAIKRSITARSMVCFVQITQDNSVIISADQEGWIEAWNSDSGRMHSSFNTHRQISSLIVSTDASRILVQLSETAQLPILCLHNTPANMTIRQERRTKRIQSASSYASNTVENDENGRKASPPGPVAEALATHEATNSLEATENSQAQRPAAQEQTTNTVAPTSTASTANSKAPTSQKKSLMCSLL